MKTKIRKTSRKAIKNQYEPWKELRMTECEYWCYKFIERGHELCAIANKIKAKDMKYLAQFVKEWSSDWEPKK
jgi:hypothetical protein